MKPTKLQFKAIDEWDKRYDGIFFYGVTSTMIFCKPSCHSKTPKIKNIIIEEDPKILLQLGFRPCKRCKPTQKKLPDDEWMSQVTDYIDKHYRDKLSLEIIAENTHSSPYHLHRKFKEVKNLTIHEYLQEIRMNQAIHLLLTTDLSVASVGRKVGIPNSSQFVRDFKKHTKTTPLKYRKEHFHENH